MSVNSLSPNSLRFDAAQVAAASARASERLGDPDWLKAIRAEALAAWPGLSADPLSSGTRYLDPVRKLGEQAWASAAAPLPLPEAAGLESRWGRLTARLSYSAGAQHLALDPALAAAGLKVLPLGQALREQPELLRASLYAQLKPLASAAEALHSALCDCGALVHVPRGLRVERPVQLSAWHDAGQAGFFPRTLVVLEEGAELTLIDELGSLGSQAGLAGAASELLLAPGSRLHYIHHQALNPASGALLRQATRLGRDSYLYTLSLATGAAFSSAHIESGVREGGASVDLLGLALLKGAQMAEIRTLQDHQAPQGSSDALVKSILRGQSRFYFDGVVRIRREGQGTEAFQSNPNLLLSKDCKAESLPTLEIEADDVACKHAASIGSIDEEARFYLLSRGIAPGDAEDIVTEGFAAELAGRLPQGELSEAFTALLGELARGRA